jgi:hypothetical protein
MSFVKEDKAAWLNSEIMQEFEKIAREQDVLNGPPPEAFQPIGENENDKEDELWEEEENMDKFKEALNEFESEKSNDLKTELRMAYNNNLFSSLEKIADQLINKSNIKAAYEVEQTIEKLKKIFKEEK